MRLRNILKTLSILTIAFLVSLMTVACFSKSTDSNNNIVYSTDISKADLSNLVSKNSNGTFTYNYSSLGSVTYYNDKKISNGNTSAVVIKNTILNDLQNKGNSALKYDINSKLLYQDLSKTVKGNLLTENNLTVVNLWNKDNSGKMVQIPSSPDSSSELNTARVLYVKVSGINKLTGDIKIPWNITA